MRSYGPGLNPPAEQGGLPGGSGDAGFRLVGGSALIAD